MQAYFRNQKESLLATYQQEQVGNSCAISAACAALTLVSGNLIQAEAWRNRVDAIPFPEIFRYRSLKGGPTTPAQQVNLIAWISFSHQIQLLQVQRGVLHNKGDLLRELLSGRTIVLVTIGWWAGRSPEIVYGRDGINLNKNATWIGYHTMLLAAYDDDHHCEDGIIRPWGFINSWRTSGSYLFWMRDDEFMRSWGIYTPGGGVRSSVLIKLL